MEAVIQNKTNKSRWQAILIFLIPAASMGMAWLMYFTGAWIPSDRTNKGALLLPPVTFQGLEFKAIGKTFSFDTLEGKWSVIVFGDPGCESSACQQSLYKTRQVHIALGKDADRLTRLYVAPEPPALSEELINMHPEVYWLETSQKELIKTMSLKKWPANQFFVVDPLGNIIMQYDAEQPGGDLLKDLKKLLKASNIG